MFPISDTASRRSFPFINYLIVFVTTLVFIKQITIPDFDRFIYEYGFIPSRFHPTQITTYFPIFTSIFLHGGFFHAISNLWFLHIFGDNIEDRFGHLRYLFFYIFAGFVASMAQYVISASSTIPMIGASGAISGVVGAYFILFRRSTVKALVTLLFFWTIVDLPAWVFLGYWFVLQLFIGIGSLVAFDIQRGGVAYFAHVGGFVYGLLVARAFRKQV